VTLQHNYAWDTAKFALQNVFVYLKSRVLTTVIILYVIFGNNIYPHLSVV